MKNIALALIAASAVATPAFAQDDATFTGPSVALIAGYDLVDANTAGVDNPTGITYGVNLGYDFQSGGVLFGIEAEASESTGNVEVANVEVAAVSRDLYAGGRIGFLTGGTLIYVKAG